MKTWTDATLCSHHCDHTGNSMSLCVFKWRPAEVNSYSHLWKQAAPLNVICWILQLINQCRWQHRGNAGEYSILYAWTLRGPTKHHMVKLLYVAFYSFEWISASTASCVSECHLQLTFCNVLTSVESESLTIHGPLWQRSVQSEGIRSSQSSRTLSLCFLINCPLPPLLCVFWGKEGVSWIQSRRVRKQCSEGSREFQLSPAFFSPFPDGSQMFFKAATLSVFALFLYPPPSLCLSLLSHILPLSLCLSFQFSLSSGITPFTKVLASPCLIVITPCQINSRSPHLFSLFLFRFSLLCLRSLCFFLSLTHHSSCLKYREMAFCFSYNTPDYVVFLQCNHRPTGFTSKCIAHVKFMCF